MTYRTVVKNGIVELPPDLPIEDGTEVEVTLRPKGTTLGDILRHAGVWHGDDAEEVIEMIYRSRSSRPIGSLS
jgi:hypothetical protein